MSCAIGFVRWILFIFNFIISLCGLALLICGVLVQINLKGFSSEIQGSSSTSAIGVIVIGCIIFVIAFFGCCGAIREHHCMVITYAIFLLSILIIQIALSVYLFIVINRMDESDIKRGYEKVFNEYWVNDGDQAVVDAVQTSICNLAVLIFSALVLINSKYLSSEMGLDYSIIVMGIIIIVLIILAITLRVYSNATQEDEPYSPNFSILILLLFQYVFSIIFLDMLSQIKRTEVKLKYEKLFNEYWVDRYSHERLDSIQSEMKCCGIDGPDDFLKISNTTEKYPWSCCHTDYNSQFESCKSSEVYRLGCYDYLFDKLCGLVLLIGGVLVKVNLQYFSSEIQVTSSTLAISAIVIGSITFLIAFFGCCGVFRENRCMIITFGTFVLVIFLFQLALFVYLYVVLNRMDDCDIDYEYEKIFRKYWENSGAQAIVDLIQTGTSCCGIDGPDDFMQMPNSTGKYPWSCCRSKTFLNFEACAAEEVYHDGCNGRIIDTVRSPPNILIGILLEIVGVELIEIIFVFCLASSIRNVEKRPTEV
ncbi:hypothetical protein PV327_010218 [Microctonus hyperodae]|uniref:Tetraspanin n=1 Tax=Microctonus hyperodae TaxID=165561 RepID=A0AA39FRZ4_MICHY|nr:hypothetical protein PV327_010218 [Microctonus hyperodae]